eukprot:3714694-Pyramimonas_sp.AAC.1
MLANHDVQRARQRVLSVIVAERGWQVFVPTLCHDLFYIIPRHGVQASGVRDHVDSVPNVLPRLVDPLLDGQVEQRRGPDGVAAQVALDVGLAGDDGLLL